MILPNFNLIFKALYRNLILGREMQNTAFSDLAQIGYVAKSVRNQFEIHVFSIRNGF